MATNIDLQTRTEDEVCDSQAMDCAKAAPPCQGDTFQEDSATVENGPPSGAEECTRFLGLDPEHVKVYAVSDTLYIHLAPNPANGNYSELTDNLHRMLAQSPSEWLWFLDLSPVANFNLYFLDVLLAVGSQLHLQGGHLILDSVHAEAIPKAFYQLFLNRCQEEHVEVRLST